jgi:hypothetical protein
VANVASANPRFGVEVDLDPVLRPIRPPVAGMPLPMRPRPAPFATEPPRGSLRLQPSAAHRAPSPKPVVVWLHARHYRLAWRRLATPNLVQPVASVLFLERTAPNPRRTARDERIELALEFACRVTVTSLLAIQNCKGHA